MTKGIILAGGSGSRLFPLTLVTSKQLLPVYDKPMIYYPLSVLLMAGIKEILIISTPQDLPRFEALLQTGRQFGVDISYLAQLKPEGIAQAFVLGEDFIQNDSVCLILGDNIFYGSTLKDSLKDIAHHQIGAQIFCYEVQDPSRYGVIELDENGRVKKIIEKPLIPPSNYAVTGLYCYDKHVAKLAKGLKPSKRGEYEITDLNNIYLQEGLLKAYLFDRGFAWLDTGTHEALHAASSYVQTIQQRQGIQIAALEEIAYECGYISKDDLLKAATLYASSDYGKYLMKRLVQENQISLMPV
jgi:glucose-1-phosphate thymidylyltransferase